MQLHTLNATTRSGGPYRTEKLNGREYWVVPFVSLVEGVLNGSKGALFYPRSEIAKNPGAWNGTLLTNGHPTRGGHPLSARQHGPEVLDKFGIGYVYNDWTEGERRGGDAYFDKEWTKQKAPAAYNKLSAGQLVELSTGLGTEDFPKVGKDRKGRHYDAVARNYTPDHLAVLTDQRGACSIDDGCGIGRNAANGKCPECGGQMKDGVCEDCGYEEETDNRISGKGTPDDPLKVNLGVTVPPDELDPELIDKGEDDALKQNWLTKVLNALWPGQVRSSATGKIKSVGSGTGDPRLRLPAQAGLHSVIPDEELALNPGWVADHEKWDKAKSVADEQGRPEDWPYIAGVYKQMGGEVVKGDTTDNGAQPGHPFYGNQHGGGEGGGGGGGKPDSGGYEDSGLERDSQEALDHANEMSRDAEDAEESLQTDYPDDPEDAPADRLQEVADAHKIAGDALAHAHGHEDFSERHMKAMDDHRSTASVFKTWADRKSKGTTNRRRKMATRAENIAFLTTNCACWKNKAGTLNDVKLFSDEEVANLVGNAKIADAARAKFKGAKDVVLAINAAPPFTKKGDVEEEPGSDAAPVETPNQPEPDEDDTMKGAMNFDKLTANDADALSRRLFGRPIAEVRGSLDQQARNAAARKTSVVDQLVAALPENRRAERRKVYEKLSLNELNDRLGDLVASGALVPEPVQNKRGQLYGGEIVLDDETSTENAEEDETFDLTTMNWDSTEDSK